MIASSQFSNLQLGNLAAWQFGNLTTWQFGNLTIWQLSKKCWTHFQLWQLSKLGTFNFGYFSFWQLSIQFIKTVNWQEIYKSLSLGNIQIWSIFNLIHQKYILTFSKKYWNHFQLCQLSILAISNVGTFQFWHLAILATCNFGNFQINLTRNNEVTFNFGNLQFWQFWQLAILATCNLANFQLLEILFFNKK